MVSLFPSQVRRKWPRLAQRLVPLLPQPQPPRYHQEPPITAPLRLLHLVYLPLPTIASLLAPVNFLTKSMKKNLTDRPLHAS